MLYARVRRKCTQEKPEVPAEKKIYKVILSQTAPKSNSRDEDFRIFPRGSGLLPVPLDKPRKNVYN